MQAQGEVVVALALRRHRESVFSLVGIACVLLRFPSQRRQLPADVQGAARCLLRALGALAIWL